MAGSDGSGEDIEAGRTNRAEDRTRLWAQRQKSDDGSADFNGPAIVIAEVALDVDDTDDYHNGSFTPEHVLDGIVGMGWSGRAPSDPAWNIFDVGGIGVVGNGGWNQGTGVLGRGAGAMGEGVGGLGVHGIGGSRDTASRAASAPPGAGVVGQGGRQPDDDTSRARHGAGVIGLAGRRPLPLLLDTGSVGVFGHGADAEFRSSVPGVPGVSPTKMGPDAPGAGVVGRGGVPVGFRSPVAAGVIGLAGDTAIPPIAETGDAGVYGRGPSGVHGQGERGPGVRGEGTDDRGGVFSSDRAAQLQLVPRRLETALPGPTTVTPTAIPVEREGLPLPRRGRAGDLLALVDEAGQRQCTLWFCVQGEDAGPARWAQVLLGPSFNGTT